MVETIDPDDVYDAGALGFAQARREHGTLFVSGQVAVDADRTVVGTDVETQARQAFDNLEAVLAAAGEGLDGVGKVTTYVVDLAEHVDGYRPVWWETFDEPYPCQTLIGVDQLSPFADDELLIEIDAEVSLDG